MQAGVWIMQGQLYACEREIISFIYGKPHDAVFAVEDFDALGSYDAVRKALSRLTQSEHIERICMGLYRLNPKRFDDVPLLPSYEVVAQALARRSHWKILPATELARRRLGLSDEDPKLPKYLSTGPKTRVKYAPGREVLLVHSAAKLFDGFTYEAAIVISALSDLDKHRITIAEIAHLSKTLVPEVKKDLMENLSLAPPRLRPIVELICGCYGRTGRSSVCEGDAN